MTGRGRGDPRLVEQDDRVNDPRLHLDLIPRRRDWSFLKSQFDKLLLMFLILVLIPIILARADATQWAGDLLKLAVGALLGALRGAIGSRRED